MRGRNKNARTYLSGEGNEMVFAHAENLDILHNDHFIVPLMEDGVVHDILDILLVSLGEEQQCLGISGRGIEHPFPIGIFTDTF
jgi:hypothetical protein